MKLMSEIKSYFIAIQRNIVFIVLSIFFYNVLQRNDAIKGYASQAGCAGCRTEVALVAYRISLVDELP